MQRTISINLEPNQSLIDTLKVYSKLYKEYCDFGFKNKIRNKVELHNILYKEIREQEPDFPSALIQTVRDVACETLKRTKMRKQIKSKEFTSMRMDKRNLRVNLIHNFVSVSSIDGRQKLIFKPNDMIDKYLGWSPVAGTLSYKNKILKLRVVVEKENPKIELKQEPNILGIDRGINNILVCSNNQFFNSKKLKNTKGKYQYLRKQLQSKGTPSARRKLKIISGRERRFVSDINHILSKNLANSNYDAFVLEDLKKIKQNKGRRFNHKLGNWSFKQFETYLTYKTQELGKLIIKVNPKYTSQECSKCHNVSKSNRIGAKFKCKKCDYELHADLNASRNIAMRGTSLYSRLLFNQPNVTLNENTVFESSYKPINSLIGS